MHVASESLAWFDPAILVAESHMDNEDDDEMRAVKRLVSASALRRLDTETLTSCALNSGTVHADCAALFSVEKRGEAIGARVEVPVCPIDSTAEPFAHIAVAGGTYAIVPATRPPSLCVFDQVNAMLISRVPLTHDSGDYRTKGNDKDDEVSAIFLDPRGRFCIVCWRSGRAEYVYIPRRPACASGDVHYRETSADGDHSDSVDEHELTPRRFPLRFRAEVTGFPEPFVIASVAWDMGNMRDTSSGDILLGSSRGGLLVACRLEHSGVVAARCVFQFSPSLRSRPITGLAHVAISSFSSRGLYRRVVFVAQRHRLFVFAGLWSSAAALSSAFVCAAAARRAGEALCAVALPPSLRNLCSEVELLDPRELCAESRAEINAPPIVFVWRYGATLVHGTVLAQKNGAGYGGESRREINVGAGAARSAVLPVNIISVARLDDALKEFVTLKHHDRTQRPLMFSLVQGEDRERDRALPAEVSGGEAEEGGVESEKEKAPSGMFDAESIGLLAQLHHKLRCGGAEISVNEDGLYRKVNKYEADEEGKTREREHSGSKTLKKDESNEDEETLVSFAMGYGHFIITTTCAVYAFCHFAGLPFPQRGLQWKQSLVFAQRLPASGKENLNNNIHQTGGISDQSDRKNLVYLGHKSLTGNRCAVGIHNTGRAQRFHIFSKHFLYDLCLGSRRRGHYIAQLLDALSPVQSAAVVGHSDDAFLFPPHHSALLAKTTATDDHYSEEGLGGRRRGKARVEKVRLKGGELEHGGTGSALAAFSDTRSLSNPPVSSHSIAADAISLERFIASHGARIVSLPGVGILGGLVEPGFCDTRFFTPDALCGMALHVAAATRKRRKRDVRLAAVRRTYAARLFSSRRYLESAAQYGHIPPDASGPPFLNALIVTFANVAVDDVEPLLLLLLLRLRGYERNARGFGGNSVEVSCLATCLVSVLLKQCSQLRKGRRADCERDVEHKDEDEVEFDDSVDSQGDMRAFLRRKYKLRSPRRLLDNVLERCQSFVEWAAIRTAVFGIADSAETIELCSAQGRHSEVLSYLFRERDCPLEGLIYLERLMSPRSEPDIRSGEQSAPREVSRSAVHSYMRVYASQLMRRFPCRFVRRGLIALESSGMYRGSSAHVVDSVDFIPALLLYEVRCNETTFEADGDAGVVLQREAIKESLLAAERARAPYHAALLYIEHALYMEGYAENSLTSLLLFFVARDSDDATLSRFFREQCIGTNSSLSSGNNIGIDMTYAYRLCSRFRRPIGCAWAYFALERYAEAVRLAMALRNEELALEFIRRIPTTSITGTVRRALWKELASTTASNRQGGSRRALQLIAESDGDLNVSDVLPHLFTDVMMIEFREELLASVASFGNTLAELRETIDASAQDAAVLRRDVAAVRRRPLSLPTAQRCAGCGQAALTRPFVAFRGCQHVLHKTCLDARRGVMEAQRRRLQGQEAPQAGEGNMECVMCSTRYLRVMLEAPLSRGTQGDIPRLP